MGAPRLSTEKPARSRTTECAAVGPYGQVRANFQVSFRSLRLDAHNFSSVFNDLGDLGLHPQVKRGIAPGLLGNEIQKVPLRHQAEKFAVGGKVGEIRDGDGLAPDLSRQMAHLLVRTLEKFVQKAQFVHDFKRRRMDGIAAKIAEKVSVLFQHHYIHPHAGQKKAQHHAGRTASGDTAARTQGFAHAEQW